MTVPLPEPPKMHFRLADLLQEHRLTQKQLAEAAGVRPATVNAIYHARVDRLEIGTLTRLVSGLRRLGVRADVGDLLRVPEVPDPDVPGPEAAARERALRLLGGSPWGLKPKGLAVLVKVSGPPIEDLLREHRGPEL